MSAERWELRQIDGAPADQRVIGVVGDDNTIVAGVPFLTDEEKRRAQLLKAAPALLAALQRLDRINRGLDGWHEDVNADAWVAARAAMAEAEGIR